MRVRWLRTALRNLEAEASFIGEDDPAAARLVVQRVLAAVAMPQDFHEAARASPVTASLLLELTLPTDP